MLRPTCAEINFGPQKVNLQMSDIEPICDSSKVNDDSRFFSPRTISDVEFGIRTTYDVESLLARIWKPNNGPLERDITLLSLSLRQ